MYKRAKIATIVALLALVAVVLPGATLAQGNGNVDVQVVITGVIAENLNEDSITDDQEDEMVFFYRLYELDADGRVLQSVGDSTEFSFGDEERAPGSQFTQMRLVAAPDSQVVFVMYGIEVDTAVSENDAAACGTDGTNAVLECLSGGDCGDLNIDLLEQCLSDLGTVLVASNDDWFENAHVYNIDISETGNQLQDIDIRDVGTNSAEYEVEYTIVKTATEASPVRDEGQRYVLFGRLNSDVGSERWPISLAIGQTATLRAIPFSGDLDTRIRVFDDTNTEVDGNDDAANFDTSNAILEFTARLGGDFEIEVSRGDSSTSGDYFLEIIIE